MVTNVRISIQILRFLNRFSPLKKWRKLKGGGKCRTRIRPVLPVQSLNPTSSVTLAVRRGKETRKTNCRQSSAAADCSEALDFHLVMRPDLLCSELTTSRNIACNSPSSTFSLALCNTQRRQVLLKLAD